MIERVCQAFPPVSFFGVAKAAVHAFFISAEHNNLSEEAKMIRTLEIIRMLETMAAMILLGAAMLRTFSLRETLRGLRALTAENVFGRDLDFDDD